MINEFLFAIFFTLILVFILWVFVLAGTDILNGIKIAAEKREEETRKSEEKRQKREIMYEEKKRRYKKNMEKMNPLLRDLTKSIFSDIRYYKISQRSMINLRHQLNIEVIINGNTRNFEYKEIYWRRIEDIEREMKADKISEKVDSKSSNSIKYCLQKSYGCRNAAESNWRYRGHCKQCYQDYVETTDDD